MAKNNSTPKKFAAMITYIIAILCLLAGLLVPLGNKEGFTVANMLGWQLPKALSSLIPALKISFGADFTYGYSIGFFGVVPEFDLGAALALVYGLITVIGLILLIPVCVSKKQSRTALNIASFIEVFALVILSVMLFLQLELAMEDSFKWGYALLIAFGGTLLMLIIQSFIYRKGSGVIKFVLFLFSAAAVLFAVFPIGLIIPALSTPLADLAKNIHLTDGLAGLASEGIYQLALLFGSKYALVDGAVTAKVMQVFILIVALLIVINYLLDLIGLGVKARRANLIANVVRYGLELVCSLVLIIMAAVLKDYSIGIMLILLVVLAALQFLINLIRLLSCKKVKAAASAPVVIKDDRKAAKEERKAQKEAEKAAKREALVTAQAEEVPAQPEVEVYRPEPLYDGPTDEFIDTLSNSEKIEFSQVFLEQVKGNVKNIPTYVVGGENSKFFSNIFIYFVRVSSLVSDNLMNKFYEYSMA